MDSNHVSSNPTSVCERIFKAVRVSTVRTKLPMSYRLHDAMPAPNTSNPVKIFQRPTTPENKKAAAVIPIEIGRAISIEVDDAGFQHESIQNHRQSAKAVLKVKPAIKRNAEQRYDEPKQLHVPNTVKDHRLGDHTYGEGMKSSLNNNGNDRFSDYINRTKLKMRATSDVGKNTPRVDSMNEKASSFIHRAKIKLRSTSSIGDRKSVSFK